jgi:hypothetical protein
MLMLIKTLSSRDSTHNFGALRWDTAFIGTPVDERSSEALKFLSNAAAKSQVAQYNTKNPRRLVIDNVATKHDDLEAMLANSSSLVLEATSLGTVELVFLLRAAKRAACASIDLLYVEPDAYERSLGIDLEWQRGFSLSTNLIMSGVPPFLSPNQGLHPDFTIRFVAFFGFEGSRLAALGQQAIDSTKWQKYAIVGVPGYTLGWDTNTLANNIQEISAQGIQSIRYCSASSVSGALDVLEGIHNEGHADLPHTIVAPLGTKPHGIATALFLALHPESMQTSLMYDHPVRNLNRTSHVRRWHLFRVTF